MGKKKKKVKAGILKRKQDKRNKLQKLKKTSQPSNKKPSVKKVKNALNQISLLIFKPEIEAISVSKEKIQAIYKKGEDLPLQVLEFMDNEVYQQFLEAVTKLTEQTPQDRLQTIALQSVLSFMQEERNKQCMNHLVVAKYYQLLSKHQLIPEKITKENILQKIQEYEQKYEKRLANYIASNSTEPLKQKIVDIPSASQQTPIEKLHSQVKTEISKIAKTEKLDLILEDVEMFFVDFLKEKEIFETKNITPLLLKRFVGYVKQNLNPTLEDLKNVTLSLEYMQKSLYNLKIFDKTMLENPQKLIQSKK